MLRWRAANSPETAGTSYIIRRKAAGEGRFTFVGVTGRKTFTDNTFTPGPNSVQYTVQGQRADAAGLISDVFTVSFGRTGEGGTVGFIGSAGGSAEAA